MATYLLLRDNKESGPYTFDELKVKGLKAYDLVWIEGRSAAWRYPGEVEELKPFSPEVVEQPYDRFFKRPSQENKPVTQVVHNIIPVKEATPLAAPRQAVIQSGSRNIYVTLPSPTKNTETTRENFAPVEKNAVEYVDREAAKPEFVRQTAPAIPFATAQSYNQQPETIAPDPGKNPLSKSIFLPGSLKKPLFTAAAVIVLIGTGIFIGTRINGRSSQVSVSPIQNNQAEQTKQQPLIDQTTDVQTASVPVSEKNSDPKTSATGQEVNGSLPLTAATQQTKKIIPPVEKKKTPIDKDKTAVTQNEAPVTVMDTNTASPVLTSHREATHRSDIPSGESKEAAKAALFSMVGLDANKYSVGTFGGISELQLTVNNHSTHALDLVVVEIQYIQANKKIFKTENLYFRNIGAGSALMQEAPKSSRGVKVQYKVTLVNSKESGISFSGS